METPSTQSTTEDATLNAAKKVLIVEDDEDIRFLVQLLMRNAGYQAVTANNGIEGLKQFLAEKPDLIILDVMMDQLDGFKVLGLIRTNKPTKNVPVIMLSAMNSPESIEQGLQGGANFFITKPFEPEDLVGAVRQLLSPTEP
jgi:DNA-binding response OmpR family regulator